MYRTITTSNKRERSGSLKAIRTAKPARKRIAGKGQSSVSRFQKTAAVEYKNVDTFSALTTPYDTTVPVLINPIFAGTTVSQMAGRHVTMKSIYIKYRLRMAFNVQASLANILSEMVRVLVVYDKQTNGGTPALSDVLAYTASSNAYLAPNQLGEADRFIILHNKVHTLGSYGGASSTPSTTNFSVSGPLNAYEEVYKDVSLDFNGPATSLTLPTNIQAGAIWIWAISDQPAAFSSATAQFFSRVRYIDP